MLDKIGYIQGRFVSLVEGKIQAYPPNWKEDIDLAVKHGFKIIELTLDLENILDTPLLNSKNCKLKNYLQKKDISAAAVTADFFMQANPWNCNETSFNNLIKLTEKVIENMGNINARILVIPFVDEASLTNDNFERAYKFLKELVPSLTKNNVRVAVESDFSPQKLFKFFNLLPKEQFGINYDLGNSASLDFDIDEEFKTYGSRIIHIHIKDRELYGTTVRLGHGNANFQKFFNNIKKIRYEGYLIFQTARSTNSQHAEEMKINLKFIKQFLVD